MWFYYKYKDNGFSDKEIKENYVKGLEKCIERIVEKVNKDGPFDGFLGFS